MTDDRVIIFDTTLRDGEQSPGISLNTSEKLEIAHQLARLGVDVIEAGFPIASPGDFEAVQAIARQVAGPRDRRARPRSCGRHRRRLRGSTRRRAAAHPHVRLDVRHPHRAPARLHPRGRQGPGPRRRRPRALAGRRRRVLADGRDPRRRRVHRRGACRSRSTRARPRSTSPTPSATRCRRSTRPSWAGSTSWCRTCATSSSPSTATTTSAWRWRTRSPACRRARGRSSARSTGSASARATRRSRRS